MTRAAALALTIACLIGGMSAPRVHAADPAALRRAS
jgi:hypothetical protein